MQVQSIDSRQNFNGKARFQILNNPELRNKVRAVLPEINSELKEKNYDVFITNKNEANSLQINAGYAPQESRKMVGGVFLPDVLCETSDQIKKGVEAAMFHFEEKVSRTLKQSVVQKI